MQNTIIASNSKRGLDNAGGLFHASGLSRSAFTLAEVLITLGIIGIVAAMTLPAITANSRRKEYSSRIKKFYSTMQQAIMRSEVDNSESIYWEKTDEIKDEEGTSDQIENAKASEKFFNSYIKPYIKYLSVKKKTNSEEDKDINYELKITMADGTVMYWHNGSCIDMRIDVNGNKQPNKSGYDQFTFVLCKEPTSKEACGGNKHFCTYFPMRIPTREQALAKCKSEPAYCSVVLQYDNWEFKDDYPFKI